MAVSRVFPRWPAARLQLSGGQGRAPCPRCKDFQDAGRVPVEGGGPARKAEEEWRALDGMEGRAWHAMARQPVGRSLACMRCPDQISRSGSDKISGAASSVLGCDWRWTRAPGSIHLFAWQKAPVLSRAFCRFLLLLPVSPLPRGLQHAHLQHEALMRPSYGHAWEATRRTHPLSPRLRC